MGALLCSVHVYLETLLQGLYGGTITFFLNHWGGNIAQAEADLSSFTDFSPECQLAGSKSYEKYNTFLEYEVNVMDLIYIRTFIFNKLIQPEDLEDDTGLAREISEVNHIPGEWVGCSGTLLGGRHLKIRVSNLIEQEGRK